MGQSTGAVADSTMRTRCRARKGSGRVEGGEVSTLGHITAQGRFQLKQLSSLLSAAGPLDGLLHRLRAVAADLCLNIGSTAFPVDCRCRAALVCLRADSS